MASQKRLLIVVAINEEFKSVKKILKNPRMPKGAKVSTISGMIERYLADVVMTSMGFDSAIESAKACVDPEKHAGVFVTGFCGGLSPELKVGDVIIASHVMGLEAGEDFKTDQMLTESLSQTLIQEGVRSVTSGLITQRQVLETPQEKEKLFIQSKAHGVDMESYGVIKICHLRKIPFAVAKIVIDDFKTTLPGFNEHIKKTGKMDQNSIQEVLLKNPRLNFELTQNMKVGRGTLEKAAPPLVNVLCRHWKIEKAENELA